MSVFFQLAAASTVIDLPAHLLADGAAILVIHAQHLLRMAMLGLADVAFLDGAGPARVGDDRLMIDGQIGEHLADAAAVVIVADDARQHDFCAKGAQHGGDAAGAAEPFLAPIGLEQDHGRFLADALGVAPYIAIHHRIADDQHARRAEILHQID